MDCFVASAPRNDGLRISIQNFKQQRIHVRILAARCVRGLRNLTLPENRGRRESRAPIAPAVVRTTSARVDHRFNRIIPAFPARRFTAYFVLSPATGLFATVALRIADAPPTRLGGCISATLDASLRAPEPHDFAVRQHQRPRSCPTSSRPATSAVDG